MIAGNQIRFCVSSFSIEIRWSNIYIACHLGYRFVIHNANGFQEQSFRPIPIVYMFCQVIEHTIGSDEYLTAKTLSLSIGNWPTCLSSTNRNDIKEHRQHKILNKTRTVSTIQYVFLCSLYWWTMYMSKFIIICVMQIYSPFSKYFLCKHFFTYF